jgi:hypothetical protein
MTWAHDGKDGREETRRKTKKKDKVTVRENI